MVLDRGESKIYEFHRNIFCLSSANSFSCSESARIENDPFDSKQSLQEFAIKVDWLAYQN